MEEGDRRAWQHALDTGLAADLLSDEEKRNITLIQLYTAQKIDGRKSVPETELNALLEWCEMARVNHEVVANILAGAMYVRMVKGTPQFELSPKGRQLAIEGAEKLGLPLSDEEKKAP